MRLGDWSRRCQAVKGPGALFGVAVGSYATRREVAWAVPDLTVVARDDLAVAWGLNRVSDEGPPDGTIVEDWSRGTRIFRRMDGEWTMVQQHVSYPRNESREVNDRPHAQ